MDEIDLDGMGPVRLEWEGDVARVVLSRPELHNAISAELLEALLVVLHAPRLEMASALVLCGDQNTFCAGADLALVRAAVEGDPDPVLLPMLENLNAAVIRLRSLPLPVVAAVEGAAVGAGMGLALAADLRVLGRSAILVPAHLGVGATPDGGVSYFLTRALGGTRAMAAMLLNRPLAAIDLLEDGLADEVVDDGTAVVAAMALARSVGALPGNSVLAARRLVDLASIQSLTEHLESEGAEFQAVWGGPNFREGVTAFLERRPPRFVTPQRAGAGARRDASP
jgi:2-(1,2-epoxy-1,2-dihydrophenyl)acetyl-CoA isomerase